MVYYPTDEGKKFRIYPAKEQIKSLSQWIGHQRFIYNSKVQEDRYFRKFKRKSLSLVGEDVPFKKLSGRPTIKKLSSRL